VKKCFEFDIDFFDRHHFSFFVFIVRLSSSQQQKTQP